MTHYSIVRPLRLIAMVAALAACAGYQDQAFASPANGTVDLGTTPPDLTSSVDPNFVVSFDDSGSMRETAMPDSIGGSYNQNYYYSTTTNLVYFNPTRTYTPPSKPDGSALPNSSYTSAWRDGMCANWPGTYCYGAANTTDLSTGFYVKFADNGSYPANALGVWDIPAAVRGAGYTGGFYYDCPTPLSNTGCTKVDINSASAAVQQNFANWFSYYRTRNLMARTAMSRAFGNLGNNIRVTWQTINALPLTAATQIKSLSGSWRDDFFRFLFNVDGGFATPDRAATIRGGEFFRRAMTGDDLDPYWNGKSGADSQELSCRQNYHMLVTDGYWNEGDPALPSPFYTSEANRTLGDGTTAFSTSDAESKIFWNVNNGGSGTYTSSIANIAFHYWSTDLQPTLANRVAPYLPDKSTGVTGSTPLNPGDDPLLNKEIYWNPANDPATWQHVVQFMITLGVAGTLNFPGDFPALRLGTKAWPRPSNNSPPAVDDTWHAAINSRGSYFSANNPDALVQYLGQIIGSILLRSGAATQPTLSSPIATSSGSAFGSGYDSSDWSGTVTRFQSFDNNGDPIDPPIKVWEAGCQLTGSPCPGGTTPAPRDPNNRVILTSDGSSGGGTPFRWANLSAAQQAALNIDPTSIRSNPLPANWTPDGYGQERVNYVRGDRTYEAIGTPQFRDRTSVLGAVINAQPVYNSSPDSGWNDNFPTGSPEATAYPGASYAKFVNDNVDRQAVVYVGANDGMLHAINAIDGTEMWAYVPNIMLDNGNLDRMTDKTRGLVPTVDNKPRLQDVFLNGAWKTVLVGSLRLGGRGVYALDVTDPANVTEAGASNVPMWEFSNKSTGGADLGYTYASPNIVRLNNGKWAVLVSSGYYPEGPTNDVYNDPAGTEAGASKTSLLIIDLETGNLIREIKTSTAPQFGSTITYGLSTPGVYDLGGDQVDDLAVAGDLAGNVWRFDLSSSNPANWTVDLMFQTYPTTAGNVTTKCTNVGDCPVTVMPVGMRNPAQRGIVWIFGTGKFIGREDRTNDIPGQAFYGVYDLGTASSDYPIAPSEMLEQDLTQTGVLRTLTRNQLSITTPEKGWTIPLDITAEPGERNVVTPYALDQSNRVVLPTLIPTGNDPCDPGRRGSLIIVDAATGGVPIGRSPVDPAFGGSTDPENTTGEVGIVDASGAIPSSGDLSPYTLVGGGSIGVLGIKGLNIFDNYWHRSSWRELLNSDD